MHVPRKLIVGNDTFEVLIGTQPFENNNYPGKKYRGGMIWNTKQIAVWDHYGDVYLTGQTTIHEILEAIKRQKDLDLPHDVLDTLGNSIHQVLVDNKLFFGDSPSETTH